MQSQTELIAVLTQLPRLQVLPVPRVGGLTLLIFCALVEVDPELARLAGGTCRLCRPVDGLMPRLAQVALGAGAFASVLAGWPELVVTLDDLVPTAVVDSATDATTHHRQREEWKPPLTMFQRQAILLPDRLAGNSGIAVDWSRVDPASVCVPPSDFNSRSGTVLDALNEYMLWTGLLVSEARAGELYALNPNVYESNRNPWRAVFNGTGDSAQMLVQGEGASWHPAIVSRSSHDEFE